MKSMALRLLLAAVGLGFGLATGEVGLRLLEKLSSARALTVSHPVLGLKVPDGAPGHDSRGFRNAAALARADVLVIGDSQTWGVNATLEEAWPQQLGRGLGRSVYNVSQGSFGTLHYSALFGLARELRAGTVVVALYLGNDLYDSYRLAYQREHWAHLRLSVPGLERDTLEPRASALWDEHEREQGRYGRRPPSLWGQWLQGHTAVGRLLQRAGLLTTDVWHNAGAAWARAHPSHGVVCEAPVRTVLTTAYRLVAVDASDIRIREGVRLSLWALDAMRTEAEAIGARLMVVLIPTKERAHAEAMAARRALDPVHARLVASEDERRAEILAHLGTRGIEALDVLPAMSREIGAGRALYPTTTESHPAPAGYRVIAEAVARALTASNR